MEAAEIRDQNSLAESAERIRAMKEILFLNDITRA
jgi:hypothetical protein